MFLHKTGKLHTCGETDPSCRALLQLGRRGRKGGPLFRAARLRMPRITSRRKVALIVCAVLAVLASVTLLYREARTPAPGPLEARVLLSSLLSCLSADGYACAGVIYVWTSDMPLSRLGIEEIRLAVQDLQLDLTVLEANSLIQAQLGSSGGFEEADGVSRLVRDIVRSGGLLHSPAILVHRAGHLLGPPILGYKTADAYRDLIRERTQLAPRSEAVVDTTWWSATRRAEVELVWEKYRMPSGSGAFFRVLPGRTAVAFSFTDRNYVFDLEGTPRLRRGPGRVDLMPSPDGRLFVTPSPSGLRFYPSVDMGPDGWDLLYEDTEMPHQYPSVGLLEHSYNDALYRVVTSWDGLRERFGRHTSDEAFGIRARGARHCTSGRTILALIPEPSGRDYMLLTSGDRLLLRPVSDPVVACPDRDSRVDGRDLEGRAQSRSAR